jgi:hypothetical protein
MTSIKNPQGQNRDASGPPGGEVNPSTAIDHLIPYMESKLFTPLTILTQPDRRVADVRIFER